MPEDLQLGLVSEPSLRGVAQSRGGLGACSDERERHQSLRAVRPVDEPGRDLPGAVPGAQDSTGGAGVGGRPFQRHPVRALELGRQLEFEFPVVEPVLPIHDYMTFPLRERAT